MPSHNPAGSRVPGEPELPEQRAESPDANADAARPGALGRRPYATGAALATAVPVAAAGQAAARPAGPTRGRLRPAAEPDFGPNVRVFDPSTPVADIQSALDAAAAEQVAAEFGTGRYAFLFRPGTYDVDAQLGYYTSVAGLGLHPDDVTINGAVRAAGRPRPGDGAGELTGSWRSAENLAVVPAGGVDRWALPQAAPLRRVHVRGRLLLPPMGGCSSGGFVCDRVADGRVVGPSQQRLSIRDSSGAGRSNRVRTVDDEVFTGVESAPARSFPSPPHTTPPAGPLSREKPFLYVDEGGAYRVFLPALRHGAVGTSWSGGAAHGSSVPLEQFFVARPTDSVRTVNRALSQGKHLLLTPGVYRLADTIRVKWSGTVVLGLGFATLAPLRDVVPMTVTDARGVRIAGLLFDAGPVDSRVLLEIGGRPGARTDPREPASVQDVFFRLGGAGPARAAMALVVNSGNVILDHVRVWRADHGQGVDRTVDTAESGVVVIGDDVPATGLFVERFQKHNVVWNGERGRTVVFRDGLPYDPPGQAACAHRGVNGHAACTVAG